MNPKPAIRIALASLTLFFTQGCGTFVTVIRNDSTGPLPEFNAPQRYGGVNFDVVNLKTVAQEIKSGEGMNDFGDPDPSSDYSLDILRTPILLADIPPSFLADTLLIPWDAPPSTNVPPVLEDNVRYLNAVHNTVYEKTDFWTSLRSSWTAVGFSFVSTTAISSAAHHR
jgi:hypothetical protein